MRRVKQFIGCCLLVLLVLNVSAVSSKTVKWLPSNKLENPINFMEDEASEKCNGVIFPMDLGQEIIVNKSQANEYVLPENGILIFRDGAAMEVTPDVAKCVRVKHLKRRSWADPSNWDYGGSKAVPHNERIPCQYDDVIFPEEFQFSLPYTDYAYSPIVLNSVTIENRKISREDWQSITYEMLKDGDDLLVQMPNYIMIHEAKVHRICMTQQGCVCHPEMPYASLRVDCSLVTCPQPHCFKPIKLDGHCCFSCGGKLVLETEKDFGIRVLKTYAFPQGYQVDLHYSRIIVGEDDKTALQISIVDKGEYDGTSAEVARYFHENILSNLKQYKVKSSTLYISGQQHIPGDTYVSPAVPIIIGTFLAVVLTFVLIYLMYGPLGHVKIPLWPSFDYTGSRWYRYAANPFTFARFENSREGDTGLIFGDRSVMGSVISLNKAFDNPLYGEPSTSGKATLAAEETIAKENDEYTSAQEKEVAMLETTNIYSEVSDLIVEDEENEL